MSRCGRRGRGREGRSPGEEDRPAKGADRPQIVAPLRPGRTPLPASDAPAPPDRGGAELLVERLRAPSSGQRDAGAAPGGGGARRRLDEQLGRDTRHLGGITDDRHFAHGPLFGRSFTAACSAAAYSSSCPARSFSSSPSSRPGVSGGRRTRWRTSPSSSPRTSAIRRAFSRRSENVTGGAVNSNAAICPFPSGAAEAQPVAEAPSPAPGIDESVSGSGPTTSWTRALRTRDANQ